VCAVTQGSRTREAVRDGRFTCGGVEDCEMVRCWADFDAAVESVRPGCLPSARVGVFHMLPEIVPRTGAAPNVQVYSTSSAPASLPASSWAETCRMAAESRALSVAVHGARLDGNFCPKRVLLAGGGSASRALRQSFADVLGAPVYAFAGASSAAAGAARRAHHSIRVCNAGGFVAFDASTGTGDGGHAESALQLLAAPRPELSGLYLELKTAYGRVCPPD
jgi:hypothetical protein